jgi:hypothetical protein
MKQEVLNEVDKEHVAKAEKGIKSCSSSWW